ncbi:hypothetical protein EXIGLDRAFT_765493 [Exidia glandulosa HHB12029]|uniref:Uncharacterized protein n=1 Tax=Exidia glandulosa HHB12029 TaxID=1314781 RepID=A0A165KFR1_EXIGL|nr:hypothetical protein EXIGLDRAFT_765493 [Exidia glandulosa HHB12029]
MLPSRIEFGKENPALSSSGGELRLPSATGNGVAHETPYPSNSSTPSSVAGFVSSSPFAFASVVGSRPVAYAVDPTATSPSLPPAKRLGLSIEGLAALPVQSRLCRIETVNSRVVFGFAEPSSFSPPPSSAPSESTVMPPSPTLTAHSHVIGPAQSVEEVMDMLGPFALSNAYLDARRCIDDDDGERKRNPQVYDPAGFGIKRRRDGDAADSSGSSSHVTSDGGGAIPTTATARRFAGRAPLPPPALPVPPPPPPPPPPPALPTPPAPPAADEHDGAQDAKDEAGADKPEEEFDRSYLESLRGTASCAMGSHTRDGAVFDFDDDDDEAHLTARNYLERAEEDDAMHDAQDTTGDDVDMDEESAGGYRAMAPGEIAELLDSATDIPWAAIDGAGGDTIDLLFDVEDEYGAEERIAFVDTSLQVFEDDTAGERDCNYVLNVIRNIPAVAIGDTMGSRQLGAIPQPLVLQAEVLEILVRGTTNPLLYRWAQPVFDVPNLQRIDLVADRGQPRVVLPWYWVEQLLKVVLRKDQSVAVWLENVQIAGWDEHRDRLLQYATFPNLPLGTPSRS